MKAKEKKIPAYTIFHDQHLISISNLKPKTKNDLLNISGVGPSKLDKYGEEVLQIVATQSN